MNTALEECTHHALRGIAVTANHVGEHFAGEQRLRGAFLFENDLQQDAAGDVFVGLGVENFEGNVAEHQVFHFGQRDVRAGVGIVQTAVGVFFDDAFIVRHWRS